MWNPGDFVYVPKWRFKKGESGTFPCLVLSTTETGWGTKGKKFDATVLGNGTILCVKSAHSFDYLHFTSEEIGCYGGQEKTDTGDQSR